MPRIQRKTLFRLVGHCALLFLLVFPAGVCFAAQAVNKASQSVFRLIQATPIASVSAGLDQLDDELADFLRKDGKAMGVGSDADDLPYGVLFFTLGDTVYREVSCGTGYIVSPQGHLVTNEHVVNVDDADGAEIVYFIITGLSPKVEVVRAALLWADKGKDLAVLRAEAPLGHPPLVFADQAHIEAKLPVSAIGFPAASDRQTAGFGFGDEQAFLTAKIHSGALVASYVNHEGAKVWEHTAPISSGHSGGPLVNDCGQVVATNHAGDVKLQALCLAITLNELLPELKKLGVGYEQASGPCRAGGSGIAPVWLYALLGLILAALAGFYLYLARLRRQFAKSSQVPVIDSVIVRNALKKLYNIDSPPVERDEFAWKSDINGRLYRFDPVMGVVYRDAMEQGGGADSPANRNGGAKPLARNTARILPLFPGPAPAVLTPGGSVSIGRDPSNSLVADIALISRRHCLVRMAADGALTLEDLGSTNGTFLREQRISAAPLKPGDVFYLGRPEYAFRAE